MSKCAIAKLLREEICNLSILADRLEDESKLCFPCEYSCDKCLAEVIVRLKQLKKKFNKYSVAICGESCQGFCKVE
jgi:hypothetical protein